MCDGPDYLEQPNFYSVNFDQSCNSNDASFNLPHMTCYVSYDYLDSLRIVTNQNGTVVSRHGYLPFGEESTLGRGAPWGATADPFSPPLYRQRRGCGLFTIDEQCETQ